MKRHVDAAIAKGKEYAARKFPDTKNVFEIVRIDTLRAGYLACYMEVWMKRVETEGLPE